MTRGGRLICTGIRGYEPGSALLEQDLESCRRAGVGGVILFDVDLPSLQRLEKAGLQPHESDAPRNIIDPGELRKLVEHVRQVLGDDVLIAVDQEGGRVARLTSARGFADDPSAREFATQTAAQQARAAQRQARQIADLGIDLNLAPCVDVDVEPTNPIIGKLDRSFGDDAKQVISCAARILHAHREAGVAACLKHFPGHGSSRADTHLGAVDITDSWQREVELEPYRALLASPGVAVMVAHVRHRKLDAEAPASLSRAVIQGMLRRDLGFAGVVITDSIDMRAIADHYAPADAAVRAVNAGADLVIDGFNLQERGEHPAVVLAETLDQAAADGRIEGGMTRFEESAARLHALRREIGTTS